MGARKKRSTLLAISLITSSVQAAWQAHPGCVVSILSLDISGAFNYILHKRLLWILRKKGLLEWMIKFIQAFLTGRTTKIVFKGYESEKILIPIGIPQGSPLSLILFLFFISKLLETFDSN